MGNSTIYKVLKQGYPATHDFKDEVDGTSGNDIDGISVSESLDTCVIVSSYLGHRKVIHFIDADAGQFRVVFTSGQITGTVDIWINNAMAQDYYIYLRDESDDVCCNVRFLTKTTIRIYSGDGVGGNNTTDVTVVEDAWVHIRMYFSCTTDKYSVWVDGVLKLDDQNFSLDDTAPTIDWLQIYSADASEGYIDAIGFSWDTNYNVGDNIHWRNYKESTDSFEGDDVGTQGASITWVDLVDTAASVELVQEFNEHKKILRSYYSSAVGGFDRCRHNFVSQAKTGWFAGWVKTSDATVENIIYLCEDATNIVGFRFNGDKFQIFTAGAWRDVTGAPVPVDDTWYYIYIQWYDAATDTFDLWIDNVLYEDGINCITNQTSGINVCFLYYYSATQYLYLDAPMSSLDSDAKADNRIFEYHPLSKTDITSECNKCSITKAVTIYSTASIETSQTLGDEHYLQIIDENSDLRFIGNRFKDIDIGISINGYSFQDLNKVELEEEDSYTASSAEDVNASLLGILTNVGQADGRLIYYTEDDPAGNLTPNYRNKPRHIITRILAIRGGKKCIIKASGKIFIDDDANPDNGAATITETSSELMSPPLIDQTSHQINYVEVRGGIDPDTGTPFSGVSQDASAQADGTGIIPYYKRLRELQSDADCQSMAIAIRTGTNFTPQILRVRLRGIYADPGEIISIAYTNKSFTATNCYVDSVRMNVLNNVCIYSLNTGIFDPITLNAPGYTMADETADDIAETLFSTDINTISMELHSNAALGAFQCYIIDPTEYVDFFFYVSERVDPSRDIIFTFIWYEGSDVTIDGELDVNKYPSDGTSGVTNIENNLNFDITFTNINTFIETTYILSASDIDLDTVYYFYWSNADATDNIVIIGVQAEYYIKRSV